MSLNRNEIITLLSDEENQSQLFKRADDIRRRHVGDDVHLRGLIEFSNICRNDCMYCGIRRHNKKVCRYRMEPEELVETARKAAAMGFKTVVMPVSYTHLDVYKRQDKSAFFITFSF